MLAHGEWTSDTTFHLEVEMIGYSTLDRWDFSFQGDSIEVTEYSVAGQFHYTGKARTMAP